MSLSTTTGKLFAIGYGLLGFPLMFLTAADIGKLLSEAVRFLHRRYETRKSEAEWKKISEEKIPLRQKLINEEKRFELPAWWIFGSTLVICCIGAVLYMSLVQGWSFVDALYFAFNAVTNVTLGDVPTDSFKFAAITVFYVIFGLAIVTMSIDLAQNHLRSINTCQKFA